MATAAALTPLPSVTYSPAFANSRGFLCPVTGHPDRTSAADSLAGSHCNTRSADARTRSLIILAADTCHRAAACGYAWASSRRRRPRTRCCSRAPTARWSCAAWPMARNGWSSIRAGICHLRIRVTSLALHLPGANLARWKMAVGADCDRRHLARFSGWAYPTAGQRSPAASNLGAGQPADCLPERSGSKRRPYSRHLHSRCRERWCTEPAFEPAGLGASLVTGLQWPGAGRCSRLRSQRGYLLLRDA